MLSGTDRELSSRSTGSTNKQVWHSFLTKTKYRGFNDGLCLGNNHVTNMLLSAKGLSLQSLRAHGFATSVFTLLLATQSVWAQSRTSLAGTVVDPTDASIGGAVVIITSTESGVQRTFTSANDGRYAF